MGQHGSWSREALEERAKLVLGGKGRARGAERHHLTQQAACCGTVSGQRVAGSSAEDPAGCASRETQSQAVDWRNLGGCHSLPFAAEGGCCLSMLTLSIIHLVHVRCCAARGTESHPAAASLGAFKAPVKALWSRSPFWNAAPFPAPDSSSQRVVRGDDLVTGTSSSTGKMAAAPPKRARSGAP